MPDFLNPAAIAASIQDNLREYSLLAARAPGGRSFTDGDVTRIDTGTAALNRVLGVRFSPWGADARIIETVSNFGGRPLTWITGPNDQPPDIGRRLVEQGFKHLMAWRGMALVMDGPPPDVAEPAGLIIRRALTSAEIDEWGRTAVRGFNMPAAVGRDFPAVVAGLANDNLALFLGYQDGLPVATASVFLGRVAGAYFVSVRDQVRRRGVASAMTRALVNCAYDRGYRLLVLEASPGGYEVYRRLNFVEYCPMDAYTLNT